MTAHVKANLKGERTLRRRLEARIEEMILLLDQLDGDSDLEDSSDAEPTLGWVTRRNGAIDHGNVCDIEVEDEHDEDGCDAEDDQSDYEPEPDVEVDDIPCDGKDER